MASWASLEFELTNMCGYRKPSHIRSEGHASSQQTWVPVNRLNCACFHTLWLQHVSQILRPYLLCKNNAFYKDRALSIRNPRREDYYSKDRSWRRKIQRILNKLPLYKLQSAVLAEHACARVHLESGSCCLNKTCNSATFRRTWPCATFWE